MKSLLLGVFVIVIVGIGGLVYRNAVEHPSRPIACPLDALICPDGTAVSRTGLSCTFPVCPPPNVTLPIGISFALPPELSTSTTVGDMASIARYQVISSTISATSSAQPGIVIINRYPIEASSTALATIQQTAVGSASGVPVNPTSFSSTVLGTHRFTIVSIERFEGTVDTAYYLGRSNDVLRFEAIDQTPNWADANLNLSTLPAHAALEKLLTTLQGQ